MDFKSHLFLVLYIILYNRSIFGNVEALIGENVRQVTEREFPFVVVLALLHTDDTSFIKPFGTGSLITNRDVITCRHCLADKTYSLVRIMVGSDDIRLCTGYGIYWTQWYEDWARHNNVPLIDDQNDVSIIRLSEAVPDDIKPVALSTLSNSELFEKEVSLAGWGKKNETNMPLIMETAIVKILSKRECERRTKIACGEKLRFHRKFLCSSIVPYIFLSSGDSGGPAVYNNTLIGVNAGLCLYSHVPIHPDKLNLHYTIRFLKRFIMDCINSE